METRGNTAKTTALKMGLAGAKFAQIAAGGKLPDRFHLLRIAECFEVTPEEILGVKMRVKLDSSPNPLTPETPNDGGASQQSPRKDDGDVRRLTQRIWPRVLTSGAPRLFFNRVWSSVPEVREDLLRCAGFKHIVIAEEGSSDVGDQNMELLIPLL